MVMLIMILSIYVGSHANTVVIEQSFLNVVYAESQCETVKKKLEQFYGSQVISATCVKGY